MLVPTQHGRKPRLGGEPGKFAVWATGRLQDNRCPRPGVFNPVFAKPPRSCVVLRVELAHPIHSVKDWIICKCIRAQSGHAHRVYEHPSNERDSEGCDRRNTKALQKLRPLAGKLARRFQSTASHPVSERTTSQTNHHP